MLKNRLFPALLILGFFLAACGPAIIVPPDVQPLPSPSGSQLPSAGPWTVSLVQTGGFAGVDLKVVVSSDGRMTAENVRSGKKVSKMLDAGDLAKLAPLAASVGAQAPQSPQHSDCADCFLYDLQVTSGGRSVHVQADDTTLAASGAQGLITLLQQLRDDALKGQP